MYAPIHYLGSLIPNFVNFKEGIKYVETWNILSLSKLSHFVQLNELLYTLEAGIVIWEKNGCWSASSESTICMV